MRGRNFFCWLPLIRLAVTVCALGSLGLQAQAPVTDFKAGQPNGVYSFATTTPKTLVDLVKPGGGSGEAANIVGHLFLPQGTAKVPVVLLMHGSGGIYDAMLNFWPKLLNAQGIGVFALDRFGPRGVKSTAEDQSQIPFTADVADAFAALRLLATHPRIETGHIAIMGFSRGGIATWRAAVERIITAQQLPDGLRFAAHIMIYSGGSTGVFRLIVKPGVFSKAPQLWVHGDADDYCPIGSARDYAQLIGAAGTPVEFVTLPGAYHKFDQDDQHRVFIRGATKTLDDCPLEMDIDTLASYDHRTGERLTGAAYQQAIKNCGAVGANVQGNTAARDKAGQAAVAFLHKVFAQ
jgi:dienelactone hydrolase